MPWFNTREIIHFYNLFVLGSYHVRAECTIPNKYSNTKTVKHSPGWNESCKMGNKLAMVLKHLYFVEFNENGKPINIHLKDLISHRKIYNKIKERSSTKQFLKASELYKKYMRITAEGEKF